MEKQEQPTIRKRWKPDFLISALLFLTPVGIAIFIGVMLYKGGIQGFNFGGNFGTLGDFFNGITTPILTVFMAVFAYKAFRSQQEQLELQKKDSQRMQIEETFFQLFGLHNNMMNGLEYTITDEKNNYTGRTFFEKAYMDLIHYYIKDDDEGEERIKHSMEKLDDKHNNNFHLYYKNLFQLFNWIYEHRDVLTVKQTNMYG
ncbi:hypothetical protein GCM10009001_03910 [Virgibacillus siamensis]|uniref:Phage abortive infection protein n=1 Tax=Virgibacillus siamensis TaxID=480071 RepID=A0ABP3QHL8_9BACI